MPGPVEHRLLMVELFDGAFADFPARFGRTGACALARIVRSSWSSSAQRLHVRIRGA